MASTPEQRDKIVAMITDSYIAHPSQSAAFVRSESRRIAAKVFGRKNVTSGMGSVAAVRANYTRASYGTPSALRRKRREELKKAVNS